MVPTTPEESPVEITPTLVESLVAEQFPQWSRRAVRVVQPGGWDNRTFRLGDELLVRLPSHARYVPQVAKEHRWLPYLGPLLPLATPVPVALGQPALGYPWPWSVYRWLEGEPASSLILADAEAFAEKLAAFLCALRAIDPSGGPPPGEHNFFRGHSLFTYDEDVRRALTEAHGVDRAACTRVWEAALAAVPREPAAWLHGDIAPGNLLVRDGCLSAVLDFGAMAVGDVACDLTIAWTLLEGASRKRFQQRILLDDGAWARARGWALWKALILIAWKDGPTDAVASAPRVLDAVLGE
ncbi:MAG: aminoglycoside phosphotransferase family protein [Myxococcales bacterium]|nr:MAG: aminoglycoside phosphotransferase family protein [Myxococcales bacterium]